MNTEFQPPANYNSATGRSNTSNGGYQRSPVRAHKPTPKPVAPKGHEAFLKAIETDQTEITIDLLDDPAPIIGYIKCSDKFTISVKVYQPDDTYRVYVIFKHAIRMFWTTPKVESKEVKTVH